MLRGTIAVRAFLGIAGWWLAILLQMQACTSRRIAPTLEPERFPIFTAADHCAINTTMCHVDEIDLRQYMTHLGGPLEDVAR
jgi:hypothetical protein